MPSPVGDLGLAPRKKKINFALKKYAFLSKFWYFFPILQHKVDDYPPSPKSGGPIPLSPRAPTPMVVGIIIIIIIITYTARRVTV